MTNPNCESESELDNSQQIDDMNSNTRFPQSNKSLQFVESSISTNVFMSMTTGVTVYIRLYSVCFYVISTITSV